MRILVVEDEVGLAESLRRGLSADGHRVEVAHDGHRGSDLALAGGQYDVVLLDLMLPGVSGHAICTRMRAHGDTTPVLVLTAKDGESDEAEGLDSGADDYLTEPFSFVVLAPASARWPAGPARPVAGSSGPATWSSIRRAAAAGGAAGTSSSPRASSGCWPA